MIEALDGLDVDPLMDALDLLGVPADNTRETNACEIANATGQWPTGSFCRDWFRDEWDRCEYDADRYLASVRGYLDKFPPKEPPAPSATSGS